MVILDSKITAVASGVVFFGNAVQPNDVRTRGNGDTLAFPQIGLQKCEVYGRS